MPISAGGMTPTAGPFDPAQERPYRQWRARKLACVEAGPPPAVEIADPAAPAAHELAALRRGLGTANLVHYRWGTADAATAKAALRALCGALGLHRLDRNLYADDDGIASLKVVAEGRRGEYIPYTSRAINWHTDGYYNPPESMVRAFALHCVCDAASGGANRLLDHELVYMAVRDRDPAYVAALMAPDAMVIPENVEGGEVIRPRQSGPVFSTDPAQGRLHLRYTARTRSIQWKADGVTREAVACLEETLQALADRTVAVRLRPGEGVLTNNVLHTREAFVDDPAAGKRRLFHRARFHDRVAGTDLAAFEALCPE